MKGYWVNDVNICVYYSSDWSYFTGIIDESPGSLTELSYEDEIYIGGYKDFFTPVS